MKSSRSSNTTLRALALVAALCLGSGCTRSDLVAVQTRYANEFSCPYESVVVRSLGAGGYRASGCGRQAMYECIRGPVGPPGGGRWTCTLRQSVW